MLAVRSQTGYVDGMPTSNPHIRLDQTIPERGFPGSKDGSFDAALDAFVSWHEDKGLRLYAHQEEALLELYSGRHVILNTPTGSGKSLVARGAHYLALATGRRSWFTAPIKALVSEKFFELCEELGAENVGLMTCDATVNHGAPIICCTAEVLASVALSEWADAWADFVVMDEFHYYGDTARGMAWQLPLLVMEKTQFVLMSATLGDTTLIGNDLQARTGREVAVIRGAKRPIPLSFEYRETPLHESVDQIVRGARAPLYLVFFTQRECAEQAQALTSRDWCSKDEKAAIRETLKGVRFDTPYGKDLRRFLEHGIGLHHAGLLPRYRLAVERLSQRGLLKVIVGTDTLGVGINVPIRSVLFSKLCKFDGKKVEILSVREFHQIGGRAGRAGFDTEGTVYVQAPEHVIENQRLEEAIQSGKKARKKVVKAQPPTKGYKHWDRETFERLVSSPPEPPQAVLRMGHGSVLTLLKRADRLEREGKRQNIGGGYRMGLEIIERSHLSRAGKAAARVEFRRCFEDLRRVGIVRTEPRKVGRPCSDVVLGERLQEDFSLHSALGLFLNAALGSLDKASPTYGLDVVSFVEAIIEQPRALLQAQEKTIKDRMMAEWKAAGMPFEERVARIEEVSYPKPQAELLYGLFSAFQQAHPWVLEDSVHPKGLLREMLENWAGFTEYVHANGMQRMEGMLLRYLSECWRILSQTVPEDAKDDQVVEIEAWLRAMIARVDSSLVQAWDEMNEAGVPKPVQVVKLDISSDPRAFAARVRAEVHQLLRCLAMQDYEEAANLCGGEEGVSAEQVESWLRPYIEEFGHAPAFDHLARMAHNTRIEKIGPHQWRVRQAILDEEGEGSWGIRGVVDLRADTDPPGRILRVLEIGEG